MEESSQIDYLCSVYSRKLYVKIVGSVWLIVVFSLVGAWLLITGLSYTLSFICLLFTLLITLFIIRLTNASNCRVALFFGSVRSHDTTRLFPETSDDPFLQSLYKDMNGIMQLFARKQMEVEEKGFYYESIIRVLTHEIRNSITPIVSLSSDLLKHVGEEEVDRQREGLEVINEQAKSLKVFLDSYHRLTHLPDPEFQAISISDMFSKVEKLMQAEKGSKCVVYAMPMENKYMPGKPELHGDPNLLTLALLNLIRNAMQAIGDQEDGMVKVEAEFPPGACPRITVTDNGPGIPAERLSAIFTPFFSTKSGGSGIGLPISQRIMQLHNGQLTVSSLPTIRTVFALEF